MRERIKNAHNFNILCFNPYINILYRDIWREILVKLQLKDINKLKATCKKVYIFVKKLSYVN